MGIAKPMMGRSRVQGSQPADMTVDLAYDYRRIVGAWVRENRIKVNLTQDALARKLDITHSGVSAIEHGRSTISPELYRDLVLELGLDEIVSGKFLLRYTNPWLYVMIFGCDDGKLKADLNNLPRRIGSNRK